MKILSSHHTQNLLAPSLLLVLFLISLCSSPAAAQVYNEIRNMTECVDPQLIDTSASIPAIYAPVCGCDGVTYSNRYEAELHYGISRWTPGPCRQCELGLELLNLDIRCTGATACVAVYNGAPPYRLFFRNNDAAMRRIQAIEFCLEDLQAGNYELLLIDAEGCEAELSIAVPIVDYQLEAEVQDVSCFDSSDGAIQLIIPIDLPLRFHWRGPNGFTANTQNIDGLSAGIYKVEVSTLNGECFAGAVFEVKSPRPLEAGFVRHRVHCEDGVDGCLLVNGGTAPYRLWAFRAPGTTLVPPTASFDTNGEPMVNLERANELAFDRANSNKYCAENIPAGVYYVLIADAKRCWTFLRIEIPSVEGLRLDGEVQPVSCAEGSDGAIELKIDGGQPPYEAMWTNERGESGTVFRGLPAGKYEVMVYDARQCSATQTFIIEEPRPIQAEFLITSEHCETGVAGCLIVNGGTQPYQLWVFRAPDANTLPAVPVFDGTNAPRVQGMVLTDDFNFDHSAVTAQEYCARNIPAGWYFVLILDANHCWKFLRVDIPDVSGIYLEGEVEPVSCAGGADGAIKLKIEGGQPPYEIVWTNERGETGTSFADLQAGEYWVTALKAGEYWVTVYDAHQCSATQHFEIEEPEALKADFVGQSPACGNGTDGCLTITGGTLPYRLWVFTSPDLQPVLGAPIITPNGVAQVPGMVPTSAVDFPRHILPGDAICANNIPAGIYYVLILDDNDCWLFKRIVIEVNPGLALFFDYDPRGEFACVDPMNGVAPYTIEWTDLERGEPVASAERFCVYDLRPGAYLVEVTDANGCSASELFFVEAGRCIGGEAIVDPAEIRSGEHTRFKLRNHSGAQIQWQFKTASTEWLDIPGATTERYVSPDIHSAVDKEIAVRAVVWCSNGEQVFSSVARLFVNGNPNWNGQAIAEDRNLFGDTQSSSVVAAPNRVQVFPTLTEGQINISMPEDTEPSEVHIIDLAGKVQRSYRLPAMGKGETEVLNLSGLATGMYLLRFGNGEMGTTQRIILQ